MPRRSNWARTLSPTALGGLGSDLIVHHVARQSRVSLSRSRAPRRRRRATSEAVSSGAPPWDPAQTLVVRPGVPTESVSLSSDRLIGVPRDVRSVPRRVEEASSPLSEGRSSRSSSERDECDPLDPQKDSRGGGRARVATGLRPRSIGRERTGGGASRRLRRRPSRAEGVVGKLPSFVELPKHHRGRERGRELADREDLRVEAVPLGRIGEAHVDRERLRRGSDVGAVQGVAAPVVEDDVVRYRPVRLGRVDLGSGPPSMPTSRGEETSGLGTLSLESFPTPRSSRVSRRRGPKRRS